jgi:hypothetical protein
MIAGKGEPWGDALGAPTNPYNTATGTMAGPSNYYLFKDQAL